MNESILNYAIHRNHLTLRITCRRYGPTSYDWI